MKSKNKALIIGLILLFILSSTISFARPVTDIFVGGLIQINNFFEGRAYEAYATAIDFFFFSLLFIAIYIIGARYAFKEVKRPEQVIVILLGLMTAFLLVLAGFSATLLLPYIHWILYLLLLLFYWWLLKGIKNKFWRFILALLLTLLTIALLQGLFGYLTLPSVSAVPAPAVGGFFSDLFKSFKGIEMPGISAPGVPDYLKNLWQVPTPAPTGPTPLPPGVPPTPPVQGLPWWMKWILFPLIILLLILLVPKLWRRIRPTPPEDEKQKIINEINGFINKKKEAIEKIAKEQKAKKNFLEDATKTQAHVVALLDKDLAYIWEEGREGIKEEHEFFSEFAEEQKELVQELINLDKIEYDLLNKLSEFRTICNKHNTPQADQLLQQLQNIISHKPEPRNEEQTGILYLITLCYNYEKAEANYGKRISEILEGKLENLLKEKFHHQVQWNEAKLKNLLTKESELIILLRKKVEEQINKLNELLSKLGETPTAVTLAPAPSITPHLKWPTDKGKYSPKPVDKPHYAPVEKFRVIPKPPEPPPTKYRDIEIGAVDLSPYFLPVKNQRLSNACVAFAGTAIMEYIINTNTGAVKLEHELSEKFLWYEVRRPEDKNVDEGAPLENAPIALKNVGECFEKLWAWEPTNERGIPIDFAEPPKQEQLNDAAQKRILKYERLNEFDPDSWVTELINNKNPILIAVMVEEGLHLAGVKKQNLYLPSSNLFLGNHAMVIVGFTTNFPNPFDPKTPMAAFKVRNSSGEEWGEDGYIWIPYHILPTLLTDHPYVLKGWNKGEALPSPKKPLKDKLAFLTNLFKTLRSEEENKFETAKNKINEFYGSEAEERNQYMALVEKIEQGKKDKFTLKEAVDILVKFREKINSYVEREDYEYEEGKKRKIRTHVLIKYKSYIIKLTELRDELNLLIAFLQLGHPIQDEIVLVQFFINLLDLLNKSLKDESKFEKAKDLVSNFYKEQESEEDRNKFMELIDRIKSREQKKLEEAVAILRELRKDVESSLKTMSRVMNLSKLDKAYQKYLLILKGEIDGLVHELELDYILTLTPKNSKPDNPIKIVADYVVGVRNAITFGKGEDIDIKLQDSTSEHKHQANIYLDTESNKVFIQNPAEGTIIKLRLLDGSTLELKYGEEIGLDNVSEIIINDYLFAVAIERKKIDMDKREFEDQFKNLILKKE